jgi:hypothetical protein
LNIGKELTRLRRMAVRELRTRYAEVFGEETKAGNKAWLIKRIAWRLQSLEEGDISQRARQRAPELANDADARLSPPKPRTPTSTTRTNTKTLAATGSDRLPPPGTILTRDYKGQTLQVRVLPKGFEFEGEVYRSLSAVAKAITGSHVSGYRFFKLRSAKHHSLPEATK